MEKNTYILLKKKVLDLKDKLIWCKNKTIFQNIKAKKYISKKRVEYKNIKNEESK